MQVAVIASSFSLFALLLIIGLIEATSLFASASLPDTLSWLNSYGAVLVFVGVLSAIGAGIVSLFTEQAD